MSTAKAPAAPSGRICEKWYKLPPAGVKSGVCQCSPMGSVRNCLWCCALQRFPGINRKFVGYCIPVPDLYVVLHGF